MPDYSKQVRGGNYPKPPKPRVTDDDVLKVLFDFAELKLLVADIKYAHMELAKAIQENNFTEIVNASNRIHNLLDRVK